MANLRVIKKDVIFLINEVISDCCTYMSIYPESNPQEVEKIIADAIALGDNLFEKINKHPKEGAKKYFKEVHTSILKDVDALFERVSKLDRSAKNDEKKDEVKIVKNVPKVAVEKKAKPKAAPKAESTKETEKKETPKAAKKKEAHAEEPKETTKKPTAKKPAAKKPAAKKPAAKKPEAKKAEKE